MDEGWTWTGWNGLRGKLSRKMKGLWFANNDISINVLSRLFTKPLLKLKCVSKEWYDLISDRSFIQFQLKRTEPISGFVFQETFEFCDYEDDSNCYIPINMEGNQVKHNILDFLPESVVILSSVNGLICCRSCFSSPSQLSIIYVCNPTNTTWVSFPIPDPIIGNNLALAFDPFRDPIDVSTNFKVVGVCETETDMHGSHFSFYIFSLESRDWRRSREICSCDCNLIENKGICIGGVLYWLTDGDRVLMFDLENELSWLIKTPLTTSQYNWIPDMCIGECEGQLHLVLMSEDGVQLWVLEDHFASLWTLKFLISLEKLQEENRQLRNSTKKVAGWHVKRWVEPLAFKDELLCFRIFTRTYLYNIKTRNMEKLCKISVLGHFPTLSPMVIPYTLSLVPLGSA